MSEDCPTVDCMLQLTSYAYDEQLGCIVEVYCTTHSRTLYGTDAPPAAPDREATP